MHSRIALRIALGCQEYIHTYRYYITIRILYIFSTRVRSILLAVRIVESKLIPLLGKAKETSGFSTAVLCGSSAGTTIDIRQEWQGIQESGGSLHQRRLPLLRQIQALRALRQRTCHTQLQSWQSCCCRNAAAGKGATAGRCRQSSSNRSCTTTARRVSEA